MPMCRESVESIDIYTCNRSPRIDYSNDTGWHAGSARWIYGTRYIVPKLYSTLEVFCLVSCCMKLGKI